MRTGRDYQIETVDYTFDLIRKGVKSMIQCMATGMGKTFTGAMTVKRVPGRALWLTHTEELIEQSALSVYLELSGRYDQVPAILQNGGMIGTLNTLDKGWIGKGIDDALEFKKTIGIIKQERFDLNAKLTVASVQTIQRRLAKIKQDHFEIIYVDECHLAMAKTWKQVIAHFPDAIIIGLTATPKRLDGASLGDLFEEFACNYDIKYGVDNGWLVPIDGVQVSTKLDISTVKTLGGDFSKSDMEKVINTPFRNAKITQSYIEHSDGKQFIAFAVDVNHTIELCKAFNACGIKTAFVVGDEKLCPNRKEIIEDFRQGKYTGLVNVTILNAGFDHPAVETIIQARPTQSETIYLQGVGRGTRALTGVLDGLLTPMERVMAIKASAKPKMKLLDIVDNSSRHNLINAWTLDQVKKNKDKIFITPEKRQLLIDVESKRETKLEHDRAFDNIIKLLDVPEFIVYHSGKNLEPATDKQLAQLKKWGYDIEKNIYSKADAGEIFAKQPAFGWQRDWMTQHHYRVPFNCTSGDYQACVKDHEKRKKDKLAETLLFDKVPFTDLN